MSNRRLIAAGPYAATCETRFTFGCTKFAVMCVEITAPSYVLIKDRILPEAVFSLGNEITASILMARFHLLLTKRLLEWPLADPSSALLWRLQIGRDEVLTSSVQWCIHQSGQIRELAVDNCEPPAIYLCRFFIQARASDWGLGD
jgi:hypothetical protein